MKSCRCVLTQQNLSCQASTLKSSSFRLGLSLAELLEENSRNVPKDSLSPFPLLFQPSLPQPRQAQASPCTGPILSLSTSSSLGVNLAPGLVLVFYSRTNRATFHNVLMRHIEECPGDRDNISVPWHTEKIKGICLLSEMSICVHFSGGQTFL